MGGAAQGTPLWFVTWHTPIAASSRLSGIGVYHFNS
jgi:Tfp pilus assembly protein PilZ